MKIRGGNEASVKPTMCGVSVGSEHYIAFEKLHGCGDQKSNPHVHWHDLMLILVLFRIFGCWWFIENIEILHLYKMRDPRKSEQRNPPLPQNSSSKVTPPLHLSLTSALETAVKNWGCQSCRNNVSLLDPRFSKVHLGRAHFRCLTG